MRFRSAGELMSHLYVCHIMTAHFCCVKIHELTSYFLGPSSDFDKDYMGPSGECVLLNIFEILKIMQLCE